MNPEIEQPSVPPRVRTVAYFTLFGLAAAVLLTRGVAEVWATPVVAAKIADTARVVLEWLAVVAGGLGVAYRPTR